jgi:hypothetical protein
VRAEEQSKFQRGETAVAASTQKPSDSQYDFLQRYNP